MKKNSKQIKNINSCIKSN